MEEVFISYVSELPLQGDSPRVFIKNSEINSYTVKFFDSSNGEMVSIKKLKSNQMVFGDRQWFTDWLIEVYRNEEEKPFFVEKYDAKGKVVFIKMDAHALGDNIAWIPYVEEFRKKHDCIIICSTFYNDIFANHYKDIMFMPNILLEHQMLKM